MPLYDYKCSKCGYIFEVQQKMSEEPLKHCPKCKGHIKRIISPAGIIFKGSGFHVTDYGKGRQLPVSSDQSKGKEKKKKEDKSKETKSSKEASSPPPSE